MLRQALLDSKQNDNNDHNDNNSNINFNTQSSSVSNILPSTNASAETSNALSTSATTAVDYGSMSLSRQSIEPISEHDANNQKKDTDISMSGGISEEENEDYEDEDDEQYDEEEEDGEEEEEDDEDEQIKKPSFLSRTWTCLKNTVLLIANVENLWDTPADSPHQYNDNDAEDDPLLANNSRLQRNFYYYNNHLIVLFWFVALASFYATERCTFKLLVDRAGPFRLFSVEMVTSTHAILLCLGMLIGRAIVYKQQQQQDRNNTGNTPFYRPPRRDLALGISVVDVGLMALLDTATLLLVFLTGYHVPPTLTVILVQFTLPLTAFLTQFVHPNGRCTFCRGESENGYETVEGNGRSSSIALSSGHHHTQSSSRSGGSNGRQMSPPAPPMISQVDHHDYDAGVCLHCSEDAPLPNWGGLSAPHVWGSLIISVAVLLALVPAFYAFADPDFFIYADTIPIRTAYNTLLYVCSCFPAAASQLYKEHVFLQAKQPVNANYLNLLLSIFQFTFASIMAPLVFSLQGLGSSNNASSSADDNMAKLYPSTMFSENFLDGLKCFFRLLSDDDQEHKYHDSAHCDLMLGLVIFHAIAIIGVGVAVDKIVNAGATKVMYRGMSAGIILAVLSMHAYDMRIPEFSYGPAIDGLNLVCLILLILGSEVYHRVALQESTFESIFPETRTIYDVD